MGKLIMNYSFIIPDAKYDLVFETAMIGGKFLLNYCSCMLGLQKNIQFSSHLLEEMQVTWFFQESFANICRSLCLSWGQSMKHNSAVPDVFAEDVEATNHTGLWDINLVWYSECYWSNLLHWFGAVSETSRYTNIAKLLTHPSTTDHVLHI